MNGKRAKQLRLTALMIANGGGVYENSKIMHRGKIMWHPLCPKGVYKRLKKAFYKGN